MKLELDIQNIAVGGDGVGFVELKGERRAVFVPGVAAGERVEVDADVKPRPARGTLLRVLRASPDRTSSPCAFVERCGACDWMHLTNDAQLRAHAAIVAQLLGAEVTPHAAPKSLGYRTRARVHVEAKRGPIVVGMFARGSREPAPVDTCVVLAPALDAARRSLVGLLAGANGRGEAQITFGAKRKPVVSLQWKGDLPGEVFGRFEQSNFAGARIFHGDVKVPATIGDPTPWVLGADGEPLQLAPGGFAQASEDGNAVLARRVAELAQGTPAVELYAGTGNLTVLLAKDRALTAIESNKDACAAMRANLAARKLDAKVIEGDAATFAIPRPTRLLVLDPPREGARAVCEAIAATPHAKLERIVYVSCDPPTLARDVKILQAAGWKLASAETFEMFPHTSHVETVVLLTRQ